MKGISHGYSLQWSNEMSFLLSTDVAVVVLMLTILARVPLAPAFTDGEVVVATIGSASFPMKRSC